MLDPRAGNFAFRPQPNSPAQENFMSRRIGLLILTASVALVQGGFAASAPDATVEFTPKVTAQLQGEYGSRETEVVRSAILAALSKQEHQAAVPDGLTLKVTVRALMPTHPTIKQQLDHPALSAARTRYLGGAELVGEVRNSRQQLLATVDYSNFADVPAAGSPSLDPWADARQTINGFAEKFAAAWDKLPKSG